MALSYAGFNLSNLAIVAGALSVGIGFGMQSVVSNFVSGLILLAERPIKVGDLVVAGGEEGYVRKISVRSTEIETFDGANVLIPNSFFISEKVKNWTLRNNTGRITIHVGVAAWHRSASGEGDPAAGRASSSGRNARTRALCRFRRYRRRIPGVQALRFHLRLEHQRQHADGTSHCDPRCFPCRRHSDRIAADRYHAARHGLVRDAVKLMSPTRSTATPPENGNGSGVSANRRIEPSD